MEQTWRGCVVPDGLLYDVALHVWVRPLADGLMEIGMTDIAQTMGGRVVQVTWMRTGRIVERGRPVAAIESAKWVGPFPTPLTGEILSVNREAFERDIAIANRDPYGAGWLGRLRPTKLDEERLHLVDAAVAYEQYRSFIDERDIRCYRCEE